VAPNDGTVTFAVQADRQVIGLIQHWEENEPDYRHAAIDIFLHPDWRGRGLDADAIRTLARRLFEQRGHRGDCAAGIATRSSGHCPSATSLKARRDLRPHVG
jgi:hypothetical protein